VIFGDGARLGEVRALVDELGIADFVTVAPLVPADRLPESLGIADLGVVTLRKGFEGLMFPSKLLGYIARGIPVLYIGPESDAAALVRSLCCGFSIGNGDIDAVADAIVNAQRDPSRLCGLGRAGRRAYEVGLTREHALASYESVLSRCVQSGRG
jgi:glycosyltransferase involved in cell wall biosynthesis